MSAEALNLIIEFQVMATCCVCGIPVVASATFARDAHDSGKSWSCLNGHSQHFTEKTEAKLRRELDEMRRSRDFQLTHAEHLSRRVSATRGQLTKIRNRIGNGVCPCCRRTFQNLLAHMQTQHPAFKNKLEVVE
jgi:hypothetical protein